MLNSTKNISKSEKRLIKTLKTNYPDSMLSISNSLKKTDEQQASPLTLKPLKPIMPSINSNNNNNLNDDFLNFVNSETASAILNRSDETNSDSEIKKLKNVIEIKKIAKLSLIPSSIEQQIQSKLEQKTYERPMGFRFYNPPNIQKLLKKYSVY